MQRRQFLVLAGSMFTMGVAGAADQLSQQGLATGRKPIMDKPDVPGKALSMPLAGFLYSGHDNHSGQHFISRVQLATADKTSYTLPFRAHDVLPLPNDQALVFGRRPDTLCALVDMNSGEQQAIEAATGRHFYGHGCFPADNSALFTTENDYDAARGVVGIRDAVTYQQIGEYESYGVGPHDIHLMPDGKTLVIANGGIETHPDFGRRKLNLKTMQPSLVYVDSESGKKIDEYRLDDHQLSIRHLVVTAAGDVGVATQYQGDIYRHQPQTLVAWQASGGELQALGVDSETISAFRGYMADLAYADNTGLLAVTSPRGNRVTFWDVAGMKFVAAQSLPEPSGIQYLAEQGAFLVSSAQGGVYLLDATVSGAAAKVLYHADNVLWDNHMLLG